MTPPNDERNLLFSNAEEEIFLPECDLVLTITEDGESSRAFSTINQVLFVIRMGHIKVFFRVDSNVDLAKQN